jgi:hypothetical protein
MTRKIVRIVLRYGTAAFFGWEVSDMVIADPDVIELVTLGVTLTVAAITEWWFTRDVKRGVA